jgi:calpain-15
MFDRDELWVRMLSFVEAGFLLGVATSQGGDGLVGGHAYSVLDVIEVRDSIVGEQSKVTDFFCNSPDKKKTKVDPSVLGERTTVRLVRIRNPWGTREWKGAWSVDSEQWTKALRKRLGSDTFAKGDGTFFMSYDDMLERFHHMDIAKTREVG